MSPLPPARDRPPAPDGGAGEAATAARRLPLLVTAELPDDVLGWADGLRRAHFPPERNRLRAHVMLFHALPPSVEDELVRLLADLARAPPPAARIPGLMKLGGGTALAIDSAETLAIHAAIAARMHGVLTRQDAQPPRLHITIQNKVTARAAHELQAALAPTLTPRSFRFRALGLYAYDEGAWLPLRQFSFRGQPRSLA